MLAHYVQWALFAGVFAARHGIFWDQWASAMCLHMDHQCRGESSWTMLNDAELHVDEGWWMLMKVFQGNDYLHDRLQHRCWKGHCLAARNLPESFSWCRLEKSNKKQWRPKTQQIPRIMRHLMNVSGVFRICVQSFDFLNMQSLHSFLFLVIALEPRS